MSAAMLFTMVLCFALTISVAVSIGLAGLRRGAQPGGRHHLVGLGLRPACSVQSMAGLESVSMFWAYLAIPVGALFCVPGIIGNLLDPQRTELETAQ